MRDEPKIDERKLYGRQKPLGKHNLSVEPHVCDFMEEEGIDWHDDKYYGQRDGMELHLLVYIDFEETVFYETYDFIPVGTRFTLLNEDTMLVEFWGKTLLARRVA